MPSSIVSRAASKGERTRAAILERAVDHALEVGLRGVTLGDLAEQVGLSKSGLYAHFGSKTALQIAVLDHAGEKFVGRVLLPALERPRGLERLASLMDAWIGVCRDEEPNGCLFVKASMELDSDPGPVRDRLRDQHLAYYDSIARIVRGGVAAGQLRADVDADQVARDLYGIMLGYYQALRLLEDASAESRARTAISTLVASVRTHPSEEPRS